MGDFYVTLISDASGDYYPSNTITNFRNKLAIPVKLSPRQYEVALVDCSYIQSNVIIKKGELLCTFQGKQYYTNRDIVHITELLSNDLPWQSHMKITNGYVEMREETDKIDTPPQPKIVFIQNEEGKLKTSNERFHKNSNKKSYFLYENSSSDSKHQSLSSQRESRKYTIEWTPKINTILGYDEAAQEYIHPVFGFAGASTIFVYCDIVEPQRVGDNYVPLLRKLTNNGKHGDLLTREFQQLHYIDLKYEEFDTIHMYIRTESGEPPSFGSGPFSATLHFRPKPY